MKSINKIYLTGYMGSGKSHVSEALAESLAWKLIDLDHHIEVKGGLTINEIFEQHGEAHFRHLEHECIEQIESSETKCVVSLGGGTYCQQLPHDLINDSKTSFAVYLKYEAQFLVKRLKEGKAHRPIIKDEDNLEGFILEHLKERNQFYEQADLIITDEINVDIIVNQIKSYHSYINQKLSTI